MAKIEFSGEQAMLLDISSKFWREKWTVEQVRAQLETERGYDEELWREMVDVGWLGMAVPESHEGAGCGLAELVPLVEPMGRALAATPFVSTQLAIQAVLASGSGELEAELLAGLATGKIGTVALCEPDGSWLLHAPSCRAERSGDSIALSGSKTFVLHAPEADVLVASLLLDDEPAVAFVLGSDIAPEAMRRETVVDETRRSYALQLDGVGIPRERIVTGPAAVEVLTAIERTALLLTSAEACGGIAGALDVTLEYLKTRRQFGRTIGSYQALKHPTVDALIGLERSRSHLYHAATVIDDRSSDVALRMAKAESCDSFAFAADRAIQFHGGVGFTYECDAQLYLRRALWCQYQFGDAQHHRQLLAHDLLDAG